jgi:hypothetical protein
MKKTKVKGTVERELDAMTPQERKKFDEEYQELLLSEAIIAVMKKDDISVRNLQPKQSYRQQRFKISGLVSRILVLKAFLKSSKVSAIQFLPKKMKKEYLSQYPI